MENFRNNRGHFVKGHSGFKPKGAINKQTRQYLESVDWVVKLLESNMEDNINTLGPKEKILLWANLKKLMLSKADMTEDEPVSEDKTIDKITFSVVHCSDCAYKDNKMLIQESEEVEEVIED